MPAFATSAAWMPGDTCSVPAPPCAISAAFAGSKTGIGTPTYGSSGTVAEDSTDPLTRESSESSIVPAERRIGMFIDAPSVICTELEPCDATESPPFERSAAVPPMLTNASEESGSSSDVMCFGGL